MRGRDGHKMNKAELEKLREEGERIEEESWKGVSDNLAEWHDKFKSGEPKSEKDNKGGEQYLLDLGEEGKLR